MISIILLEIISKNIKVLLKCTKKIVLGKQQLMKIQSRDNNKNYLIIIKSLVHQSIFHNQIMKEGQNYII
jgi:hypothetical protein